MREAEADEDLVENQHDAALGADRAQPLQPFGIGRPVEMRAARAVDERRIRRRIGVGVQRLQRIDQHAGDVAPLAEHAQRILRHIGEGISLARRHRIADARLNVAPPAVIGTAEPDQMGAARVIARQAHRLHHRFGARHVERHFVEPRDLAQALDVVSNHRMIGAEHRPEIADALRAALDAFLIEIVPEEVDTIGACQVVEAVAVEIGKGHAGRRLHERGGRQCLRTKRLN